MTRRGRRQSTVRWCGRRTMLSAPQVSRLAIGLRSDAYTSQPMRAASNGMEPPRRTDRPPEVRVHLVPERRHRRALDP